MNIKEFTQNFCEQFDEEVVDLSETVNFRELEQWSSLTALNVLAMISEEYDVDLNPDEMRKTNTIQELFELVQSKL